MDRPDLSLVGWRVATSLDLPWLKPWDGADRPADIEIIEGPVPDSLPGEVVTGPFMRIDAAGVVLIVVPGVARYLVGNGSRVVVARADGADPLDMAAFLMGSVFGILCHKRGVLPLHASAVEVDGRAHVNVGDSGAGKSTLAAAMGAQGYRLLADDVTVLDAAGTASVVLPELPYQKLWEDSLCALRLPEGRRLRESRAMSKYEHRMGDGVRREPLPLGAVFHLSRARLPADALVERLPPNVALKQTLAGVYRERAARQLGLYPRIFAACGRITAAVPHFALRRSGGFENLDLLTDALIRPLP